ncbi:hypothetical protein DFH08DRAFT_819706 [Mycena albidolilacea]|uniref:Uncharacterized protein n=1 Tax=Mycena albidolilacea TaxID=1033008 RepID=A0AAD6ZDW5_9AGAR|nr:hypothetical protein DFH08DRAFT_819706 [Mycena albidolilacea]
MHRPQASTSPTISIHDPGKFTPTWREVRFIPSCSIVIKDYVYIRSHSHPFVDVDEGNKLLWSTVIKGCMDSRRSRCLLPGSQTELAQVTVKGLHGLKLRIADFYSALETDPYYFEADQNPNDTEMEAVHLRMLANYCSWIRIAATSYFVNEDSAPTTACVIYTTTHQRKVLPILAPTGGAPGAQPVLKPGSGRFRLDAAVFPNLSEYLKDEARKLQEKNLQGFMEGLTFTGLSPLAIQELGIHWGHCAETLALLYMLDPEVSVQYFLNGMAADVRSIHKLNGRYNRIKFVQEMLKPACTNCQTVIHSINDEMQIIAKQRNQRTGIGGPFIYLDRGSKMIPGKRLPEVRRYIYGIVAKIAGGNSGMRVIIATA